MANRESGKIKQKIIMTKRNKQTNEANNKQKTSRK
jgi:hypothetical protein